MRCGLPQVAAIAFGGMIMDVFDLDRSLIGDYSRFARSFAEIRADDIRSRVAESYEGGSFGRIP
jgi:hypothetical protein